MALEDKEDEEKERQDFAAMTDQSWPTFDENLQIKQRNEPRTRTANHVGTQETGGNCQM